jgi:outer membrane protein assembly factor BamB
MMKPAYCLAAVTAAFLSSSLAQAQPQSWTSVGGNAQSNGLVSVVGPDAPDVLWEGGELSWIPWQPFIEGRRVFLVRQNEFPSNLDPLIADPTDAPIIALDLDTGAELWRAHIPYEPGNWTTWIAGVSNGRIFASRSGNGGSRNAPLYCLDAATGAILWNTAGASPARSEIASGTYNGAVFAPNGDPVIASPQYLDRYDALTGARLWRTPRVAQVWEYAGAAIFGNAVYVADLVNGINRLKRFNLTTGAFEYQGPAMVGGNLENAPFVGLDGRIYVTRAQNNDDRFDFLYSFTDTGTEIVENWRTPAHGGGAAARWGVGPDGSIYSMSWTGTQPFESTGRLQRINPATGLVVNESTTIIEAGYMQIHMAIDQRGVLYVSNGAAGGSFFPSGKIYSFNADLTERWVVSTGDNLNQGGPALGTDGTLVVAGPNNNIWAYRTIRTQACGLSDVAGPGQSIGPDNTLTADDIIVFLNWFFASDARADVAGPGQSTTPDRQFSADDIIVFLNRFFAGC